MASRALKTLTDASVTAAYDPNVYSQIVALVNVEGWITCLFPNGDTLDFCGYLKSFTPGENAEGNMPEADITIICTNKDALTGVETAPVFTAASSAT
jgi:hypothetical protein